MSKCVIVVGLGFGDEGKGTITQYLAHDKNAGLVVRYNGGPQAAHNVYSADGKHHTFSQFGSATFEGVRTHLSRHMLFEPNSFFKEGKDLVSLGLDPYDLVTVDRRALLITPYHWSANRLREIMRGEKNHGSCGAGVGETMSDYLAYPEDAPVVGDLEDPVTLLKKLVRIQERKHEEFKAGFDISLWDNRLAAMYRAGARLRDPADRVVESYKGMTTYIHIVSEGYLKHQMKDRTTIFEGAQGALLDQDFGFQPHTTWSDTAMNNAYSLMRESDFDGEEESVGVLRTYMTRHGVGPLPTEIESPGILDRHNSLGLWQGPLRVGYFDSMLAHYALRMVGGVDSLAITHVDQYAKFGSICTNYEWAAEDEEFFRNGRHLRLRRPFDMEYQTKLTEVLRRVKPVYKDVPPEKAHLAEMLSDLETPISILSAGPHLNDKVRVSQISPQKH